MHISSNPNNKPGSQTKQVIKMAEKVLDKKGQKTPAKGNGSAPKGNDKGTARPEASKKGNDTKKK